ncbi:MAG: zf-HC2 domain-containing protein [Chthonomonadales bacterium]|nr:zf-HC2 domain-containing protein [Chthonomonadales bacterium]
MRCDRAQQLFSDYIDDSLQRALRVPFEAHLAACAGCRGGVEMVRGLWGALESVAEVEPPWGLRAEVWRRIDAQAAPEPARGRAAWWRFLRSPGGIVATATAAVLLAMVCVSVPGSYSVASLLPDPIRRMLTRPPAEAITVVGADLAFSGSGTAVDCVLRNRADQPITVEVTARAPSTAAVGPARTMVVPAGASVRIEHVEGPAGAAPGEVILDVRWADRDGTHLLHVRPGAGAS